MSRNPAVGDPIRLGDTVGHPQEPHMRWARVVAIRKDGCKPIERIVIRCYRSEEEPYPTGEYRTTWLLVPWSGHTEELNR